MRKNKTFFKKLDNLISDKIALLPRNQGTKKPNGTWHQIDLRGNGLIIKHCSNDSEAHLARFVRQALENNNCVNKDSTGRIVSYPGLYARYYKHYLDLRLDVATANYGNKVGDIMKLIANTAEFNLPLVGQLIDTDGATFYRYSLLQPKPLYMDWNQIMHVPYDQLDLGELKINLNHCEPILISGISGTGKSQTLELLLAQIVPKLLTPNYSDPMIYVADPKFSDLKSYTNLIVPSKYCMVAQAPARIAEMLEQAVIKMNARYQEMQNIPNSIGKTALDLGFAPQFVLIDEYTSLLASLCNNKTDKALKAQIEQSMTQLVQKARQASILMIISLQRASVDSGLASNIRANCDLKILLGNSDATTTAMLFGSQEGNNLAQINQVGGGYYQRANMQLPEKFYVPDFDLAKIVKAYQLTPREHIMKAGRLIDGILENQSFDPEKLAQIKNELTKLTHSIKNKSVLTTINAALSATNQALTIDYYNEDLALQIQHNLDRAGDRIVYYM